MFFWNQQEINLKIKLWVKKSPFLLIFAVAICDHKRRNIDKDSPLCIHALKMNEDDKVYFLGISLKDGLIVFLR